MAEPYVVLRGAEELGPPGVEGAAEATEALSRWMQLMPTYLPRRTCPPYYLNSPGLSSTSCLATTSPSVWFRRPTWRVRLGFGLGVWS
jgi:hypothetical protein